MIIRLTESEKNRIKSLYEQESISTNYVLNNKNLSLLDTNTKDTINQQLNSSNDIKSKLQSHFNETLPKDLISYLISKGIEPYINVRGNETIGEKVIRTGIYFNLGKSPFGINLNLGDNPLNVLGRLDNTRVGVRIPF
jgi:hypothetical protein